MGFVSYIVPTIPLASLMHATACAAFGIAFELSSDSPLLVVS
jgi:uncharacterized protein YqgC (DUF456 family)